MDDSLFLSQNISLIKQSVKEQRSPGDGLDDFPNNESDEDGPRA